MKNLNLSYHNNRILFAVDHKHRDLPSLSLIGFFLNQMGYETKFVALWKHNVTIQSFNPKYIVLPKPHLPLETLLHLKQNGHKLIIINTEGNNQDINHKYKIRVAPDLFFFWNKSEMEKYRSLLYKYSTLKLTGYPRSDFLHKYFLDIFPSRKDLLESYNLPLNQKTITIATCTPDIHFSIATQKAKAKSRKRLLESVTYSYWDIISNMKALNKITKEMIAHIITYNPKINIIVKPHPNESISYWKKLVDSSSSNNIHLCVGEPINNLLRVSDLHIAHNVCTTTVEAMMVGIPAAEIHSELSQIIYGKDHLEIPDYIIKSIHDLDHIIQLELFKKNGEYRKRLKDNEKLQSYIKKYFHKFDGLRCYEYTKEIADFIEKTNNESTHHGKFFLYHPKYVLPYLNTQIRQPLSYAKRFIKKQLIHKQSAKDTPPEKSSKETRVDNRGRYDNRIKPGDEEYWFKKFEEANFRIEEFEKISLNKNDSSETIINL